MSFDKKYYQLPSRDDGEWRAFYPEIVAYGSLAEVLTISLKSVDSVLTAQPLSFWPAPSSWAFVKEGKRSVQLNVASLERLFLIDFWKCGVTYARGASQDLIQIALASHMWVSGSGTDVDSLERAFTWLRRTPGATAFEEGRGAEWVWDRLLQRAFRDQLELEPFLLLAVKQPSLIQLYPSLSMGVLCFRRNLDLPGGAKDYPSVWPIEHDHYRVMSNKDEELGRGDAAFAVDLLLRNLPSD